MGEVSQTYEKPSTPDTESEAPEKVTSTVGSFDGTLVVWEELATAGSVGGAVSTVKLRLAGVGSVLLAVSVARTSKIWAPFASAFAGVWGLEQGENDPESKRHSNVEPPSSEENAKVGVESLMNPDGPEVIVVSGGSVSGLPPTTFSCGSP